MDNITRTFNRMQVVYKAYDAESDSIETLDCWVYTSNELKAKKAVERRCEKENKKLLAIDFRTPVKITVSMTKEAFIRLGDLLIK